MQGIPHNITDCRRDMMPSFQHITEKRPLAKCTFTVIPVIEHLRIRTAYPLDKIGRTVTFTYNMYMGRHDAVSKQVTVSFKHSLRNAVEHHAIVFVSPAKHLIMRCVTDMVQSSAHNLLHITIIKISDSPTNILHGFQISFPKGKIFSTGENAAFHGGKCTGNAGKRFTFQEGPGGNGRV